MSFRNLTKEDFANAKKLNWNETVICNSIVIIPDGDLHDSGWGNMSFAAMKDDGTIIGVKSYGSDVLDIDGIGGYGERYPDIGLPTTLPIRAWAIDCLPCGYLRLFSNRYMIKMGDGLSSFSIYGVENYEK